MNGISRKRLAIFLGVLTSLAALFMVVSQITGLSMVALAPAYMFTPLIAGVATSISAGLPLRRIGLHLGRPWWLMASALLALPLVVVTLGLSIAFPGIAWDPTAEPVPGLDWPTGLGGIVATIVLVLVLGTTVNALLAFGEELGWRGYLLWELAPLGFWKASAWIGAIWGVWHAPVIVEGYNFPHFPIIGVVVMTLACIAFAPFYTYIVLRSKSVIAAALFHGVFNGSAGMVLVYTTTDNPALADLVANPVGGAGIAVFAAVALLIAARGTPVLHRDFAGDNSRTDDLARNATEQRRP